LIFVYRQREKFSEAYESLAAKGVPEYAVYIRENGPSGTMDGDWKFVGSLAVPRNLKVSDVIYENEQNLLKGALKLHPRLKDRGAGYSYG
jgi:hypothetical protein